MPRLIILCAIVSAVSVSTAFGQGRFEIQPFIGYKFGGGIPVGENDLNFAKIQIQNKWNAGLSVGVNATENIGVEFSWNRQPTKAVGVLNGGGEYPEKINVHLDQFHGNFVFHIADEDSRIKPFLLFGIGATRGGGQGSSETKFSYALGAGLKYFMTDNMGVRLQARYSPTYLYSEAGGLWCNWWGYCWVLPNDKYLQQGDLTVGWIFSF